MRGGTGRHGGRLGSAGLWLVALGGPVVYPALVTLAARRRPVPLPAPTSSDVPPLTVVVAAYREASVIAAKIADCRANGYAGEVEVLVVADDAGTAEAARAAGARVLADDVRRGKAAALNRGVAAATTEIVVVTDANAFLRPGSLEALAGWFADPQVGAVAGEKQVLESGQGAYWRFESALKRAESRLGGTIGLVGEVAAVRRSAWRPLPADVAVDDLWVALDVLAAGLRVVYEPRAVAMEAASADLGEEWERRTRVVAGMIDVVLRRRSLLVRRDLVAAQLWGHRLLRATLGPAAHAALLGLAVLRSRTGALPALFVAGNGVAAAALALRSRGRRLPRVLAVPAEVAFLQLCGLGGTLRYLRRERLAVWPKPERSEARVRP